MRANAVYLRRLHRQSQFVWSDIPSISSPLEPSATKDDKSPSHDSVHLETEKEKEAPDTEKSVLKRVFGFFQMKGAAASPPRGHRLTPPSTRSLKQPSLPKMRRKLYSPDDFEDDKENIPPKIQTAVSLLHSLRQQDLNEAKRISLGTAPSGVRRLAEEEKNNHFSKQSTEKLDERSPDDSSPRDRLKPNKILRRSLRNSSSGDVYVTRKHFRKFSDLLEDPLVLRFLTADVCRRYADKYLIAMVFTYFLRAKLQFHEFTKENFFAGLYLAHDMEEDDEELKYEVFPWVLGHRWRKTYPSILQKRDNIFWAIDCRAVVSKKCCDQVMDLEPDHWVWKRERPEYHGGAVRNYLRHEDDNGKPRGPDKSPLQCLMCLERQCLESESSYLLYLSDSEFSNDDKLSGDNNTALQNEKDSGFETFLCEKMEMENSSAHDIALYEPENNQKTDQGVTTAQTGETNMSCVFNSTNTERKNDFSDNSSAYDLSIDSGEEMEYLENNCPVDTEKVSQSQADTISYHSEVQSKLSQEL